MWSLDRAIRRAGELLKQIEPAHGASQNIGGGVPTNVTRKSAAADAGMSKRQQVTAIRVANVPADEFVRQLLVGFELFTMTIGIYCEKILNDRV